MPDTGVLPARFLNGLSTAPTGTALRVGAVALEYARVHELALRWAGALRALPGQPGVVAVLTDKGVEAYVGVLATLYAGTTVVPLHAEFPVARTRRMLELSGAAAVLVDDAGLAAFQRTELDLPVLHPGRVPLGGRQLDTPVAVAPSQWAYVLFTSGSTGTPKGVPLTHAMLDHYFRLVDRRYGFGPDDVFSQTFDLNFDCAIFDLFCAWGAGATVQAVPAQAYRGFPAFVAERGITVWFSAPSAVSLIRRMGGLAPNCLPGLRWSLFAGEALQADDVRDWLAAAPGSTVENLYGPTELTLTVTAHRWSAAESPGLCVNGLVPIGTPHDGHEFLLLAEDGTTTAEQGELCVAGPQLTPGYLDPADGTGRFLDRAGRRWYRTGDQVRLLRNGELVYLGRNDTQIQVNGWRVELTEIEHAVRGCPGVTGAVAVPSTGEDGVRLVVFYTGEPTPAARLNSRLRTVLPKGMLPRRYAHVAEFPLNSNRKIDRLRLTEQAGALLSA